MSTRSGKHTGILTLHQSPSSSELCRKSSSESEYEIFDAIECSAVPGSHGIRNLGEARGTGRGVVNEMSRQGLLDLCAAFFTTY